MITEEELDRLIESQHIFFSDRTLEQMTLIYAQYTEDARNAGQDEAAAWYASVAAALYERLNNENRSAHHDHRTDHHHTRRHCRAVAI
jgi:hypothetical protein